MRSGFYGIIAFIIGFSIAQASKFVIARFSKNKKKYKNFKELLADLGKSGGMPSGHSASFTALLRVLGLS